MNKTVKKILLFFTFLCAIVLIVFAVELLFINRDTQPSDPASTDTSAPDVSDTAAPSASPDATGTEDDTPQDGDTPQTGLGTLYELPFPGGMTLLLIADETVFEHQMMDMMGDLFTYIGSNGAAALEITFVEGGEGIMLAPAFLDNYIDYTGGEFYSELDRKIEGSDISGVYVTASNNGETYEAWLVDFEGGVMAFVLSYSDETQRAALCEILNSMELVPA